MGSASIADKPGGELETEEQSPGLAAFDTARAYGLKNFGDRVEKAAAVVEFG